MDRFLAVFRHVQSNPESLMNGICGLLALASVRLYSTFHFSCPCLPFYNTLYGLAVLLLPAFCLLLCGVLLNRRWVLVLQEWRRPDSGRSKDEPALRYLLITVLQGAVLAPTTWLLVALLDAKCIVCAFATCVEPGRFANVSGYPEPELRSALARVPCKDLGAASQPPFPGKAIYRYLRTISQALGWITLLLLMLLVFLARSLRPCSQHVTLLQTWYWGNFLDLEQKVFEEMCREHAHCLAEQCVSEFFDSVQGGVGSKEGEPLHGITSKDQMNLLLQQWSNAKPPLSAGVPGRQAARSWGPASGTRLTQV
ncbi:calcium homeostasis modulator protein 3-like [Narcine bancroftii]|uniref:calcium homeostasis modulator protein 3-like n=1 Tax=Narcine bancroftii TaxID=1343680 RepID=UPI00383192F7